MKYKPGDRVDWKTPFCVTSKEGVTYDWTKGDISEHGEVVQLEDGRIVWKPDWIREGLPSVFLGFGPGQ